MIRCAAFVTALLTLASPTPAQGQERSSPSPQPATDPVPEPPLGYVPGLQVYWGEASFAAVVSGPSEFFGIVLVSPTDSMQHFFVGLPPILADAVVLGSGFAKDSWFVVEVARQPGPKIQLWAQALVIDVHGALSSSPVVVSVGGNPQSD
jgi:hypothetical protein